MMGGSRVHPRRPGLRASRPGMLLPRSRYDEGVETLKDIMAGVPYGDPQRPDVLMGPVISAKQRDRVLGYIEKGVAEGATLALGGGRPERPRQGLVRRAHPVHRRRQLDDHRPGGDLRAGPRRHPRTKTRTTPSASPTTASTGWPARSRPDRSSARWPSPAASAPASSASTAAALRRRPAVRRLQAQRHRPPERHRRLRPVPRDQVARLAGAVTPNSTQGSNSTQ